MPLNKCAEWVTLLKGAAKPEIQFWLQLVCFPRFSSKNFFRLIFFPSAMIYLIHLPEFYLWNSFKTLSGDHFINSVSYLKFSFLSKQYTIFSLTKSPRIVDAFIIKQLTWLLQIVCLFSKTFLGIFSVFVLVGYIWIW